MVPSMVTDPPDEFWIRDGGKGRCSEKPLQAVLTEIDREIWIADGSTVRFLGIYPYPTRLTHVSWAA